MQMFPFETFRDEGKGTYVAPPVNGFGKVKRDAPPDLWRGADGAKAHEVELQPLKANEYEAAIIPPTPGM